MKKLFLYADQYIKESDWKLTGLLKSCLLSLGICAGLTVPARKKRGVFLIAFIVFLVTLIPLLIRFNQIVVRDKEYCRRHIS